MKTLTLDSTILNTISLCERRTKYQFIDGIQPSIKGEALERGDLMHKMLEIYEGLRCGLVSPESPTWRTLFEAQLDAPTEDILPFSILAGRYFATKMDLHPDEIEATIFQFEEYQDFYKDDPWETLAVEEVGSKILYEDSEVRFIYTFKIDRLAKRDKIIAPWDYKTSKKRSETSSLSNQFIGYAWATDSNYVIVDKIGFQKTLSREERFQRIFLSYDAERIEEWRQNAIKFAWDYYELLNSPENASMNLTSCDKFGGCIYRPICEKAPSAREWIISRDFVQGEKWDPAKELEVKES